MHGTGYLLVSFRIIDQITSIAARKGASVQEDLDEIENQFIGNREEVIDMLLERVMDVTLKVPYFIKQNFVIAAEEWN